MAEEDHDLLVELNTKMSQLCRNTEKNYQENNKAHEKIMTKIDDNHKITNGWVQNVHERIDEQVISSTNRVDTCHKTFLQSKVFYWVAGFIIAGVLTAWGAVVAFNDKADERLDKVEQTIEQKHPGTKFDE